MTNNQGSSRIGGDWSTEALEAFRSAYGQQMMKPDDHDVDSRMGLPTENISNTSPWIMTTGLWKANDGMSRDFKPNQPFDPDAFINQAADDDEELSEDELEAYLNELSLDELKELAGELGVDPEEDYGSESMSDEEIETLINELTNE